MKISLLTARHRLRLVSCAAAAFLAACGGGDDGDDSGAALEVRTLSNRADLISGGDALVTITRADGAALSGLKVEVGRRDVSDAFTIGADGAATGLVTGLADGDNVLQARSDKNDSSASLTITNTPGNLPVLSGASYVTPFYCAQPAATAVNGDTPALAASGLSGSPDAACGIATEYKLYYKTTAQGCSFSLPDPTWRPNANATSPGNPPAPAANLCFKPYDPQAARPNDMAQTTTDAGKTVDYIVRVERGTINRGIYDMVALFDPTQNWTPTAPQAAWNGKVWFNFGSSTGQPRRQVRPQTAWPSLNNQIGRGYLVAMNSMTDSDRNSNRVLMAETVMRMKEHIIESYGPVKFAIGSGCSGGSINSNMTASIMPGLLDGVITSCTYPDSESTTLEVGDCVVLVEAYLKPQMQALWAGLSQAEINARKAAINGHPDQTACHGWYNAFGSNGKAGVYFQRTVSDTVTGAITQATTATNNCELPNSAVYDPARPTETAHLPRCNAWGWAKNIWGEDPGANNQALHTRDNVGVQYGLKALQDGVISAEEFVTLNELAGGTDRDSTLRPERTVADPSALGTAYRSGILMSGKQLAQTAMIDLRGWDDSQLPESRPPGYTGTGAIHHTWYSFAIRERLAAESGDAGNQAMWRFSWPSLAGPTLLSSKALDSMSEWLTQLKADTSNNPLDKKVRDARPASAADLCYLNGDTSLSSPMLGMDACDNADQYLKPSLSPRQVAGGPQAENILKCQLKPLAQSDYAANTFTEPQWTRLRAVFPGGVCDWSKPGVGQQTAISPLTFKAGPGGVALPDAPVSGKR
ncbi:MAG: DUF6351 family protein [Burkholderiaceae bacterium]|jgi:hypothetical protein|nr:DUF6351 family protein [Burkholderiaceae bacterium]